MSRHEYPIAHLIRVNEPQMKMKSQYFLGNHSANERFVTFPSIWCHREFNFRISSIFVTNISNFLQFHHKLTKFTISFLG